MKLEMVKSLIAFRVEHLLFGNRMVVGGLDKIYKHLRYIVLLCTFIIKHFYLATCSSELLLTLRWHSLLLYSIFRIGFWVRYCEIPIILLSLVMDIFVTINLWITNWNQKPVKRKNTYWTFGHALMQCNIYFFHLLLR